MSKQTYFESLPFRLKIQQLQKSKTISNQELSKSIGYINDKKIAIIGCGSQGLNQGLNLKDSGLDVSYVLTDESIKNKTSSWHNATINNFKVGSYQEIIPNCDIIVNLTPDKNHTQVITEAVKYIKKDAVLIYSHGFNIVEENISIRSDITVILVSPKGPGTELREEYKRGFGVPALIAVHEHNNPNKNGLQIAKAYATSLGANKAGVIETSFIGEVKSDLMGEQTILCGLLQTTSILCFDKMIENKISSKYACKLIQKGWEVLTESLKHGGITNMMDRLSNNAKIQVTEISNDLKLIMKELFEEHMDNILSGDFSHTMMADWENQDKQLLHWREQTKKTNFEQAVQQEKEISEQEIFNNTLFMTAIIKAGVELAFEIMTSSGISPEIAYYESLHELPLIANLISRKKLYEMNKVISDTAEYGCYLFSSKALDLLKPIVKRIDINLIGNSFSSMESVDNKKIISVNKSIRNHPIEIVGSRLRNYMTGMKKIFSF